MSADHTSQPDRDGSEPKTSQVEPPSTISRGKQGENFKTEELSEPNLASSKAPTDDVIKALSPISLLAKGCLERFKTLHAALYSSQSDKSEQFGFDLDSTGFAIEDAQARFKAWGSNIAAFHNGTLRTSLDFRLAEAPGMKRRTLQILADLEEYLSEATWIITGEKVNETWSLNDANDSSDYSEEEDSYQKETGGNLKETEAGSSLNELLKAIKDSNASLMKLSIVIRSSATRDDYLKAASRFKTWNPYADIGHVREKYGSARHTTDWLLERLGKAITRRRQFLRYRIEHNDRLAGVLDEDEGMREKPEKTIIASTKATTFMGENILQNVRAPGSDTGNSFGSQTSYEATIYKGDGAPRLLTVPPPPKFAFPDVRFEYGEPFKCPYCFTEQVVKNKGAWKKHVFRDLKPYVCTFSGCELLMFRSRIEWFTHELQNHRREWVCQFCQEPPFTTVSVFTKHIKSTHPTVLASSSLEALVLQSEEPMDKIPSTACPLCDDWEADLKRKQANLEAIVPSLDSSDKHNVYGKPKLFRRHLGRHMEQLALFALPSNNTDDLEDESTDEEREDSALPRQGQAVEDESSEEGEEDGPEQIFESAYEASTPPVLDTDQEGLVTPDGKQSLLHKLVEMSTMLSPAHGTDLQPQIQGGGGDGTPDAPAHPLNLTADMSSPAAAVSHQGGEGDTRPIPPKATAETGSDGEDSVVSKEKKLSREEREAAYNSARERIFGKGENSGDTTAGEKGRTALHVAAERGYLDVVEMLLQEKAEVNAAEAEEYGRTALQTAAEGGHLAIVERLLQEKAEVNAAAPELKYELELEREKRAAEEREKEYQERLETDLRKAGLDDKQIDAIRRRAEEAERNRAKEEVDKAVRAYKAKEAESALREKKEKEERDKIYQKRLEEDLRKAGMDERQIHAVTSKEKAIDPERPIYTRMSRRHISIETLNTYKIDHQFDEDPDYVLIQRWVPEYEQDFLWSHTREIREKRQPVLLAVEGKGKKTAANNADFEFVRKKEHRRKPSPSPILAFLAGAKSRGGPSDGTG